MKRTRGVFLGAIVCLTPAWTGCGASGSAETEPGGDGDGTDAGAQHDGSVTPQDSGTPPILGNNDAGVKKDASAPIDAASDATQEDATAPTDSGPPDGGATCAPGICPINTYDIDGNPLTGTCGCEYACIKTQAGLAGKDPVDPDYADENCDGSDGVIEHCVFVASSGADTNVGTRQSPVKTIAKALTIAQTQKVDVCLAGEKFSGAVSMIDGISIYGGFNPSNTNFAFKRDPSVATILEAEGTVVTAPVVNAETHLEGLTLFAQTPAQPGASTYGVRFAGGSGALYVRYNSINTANGAPGANGNPGTKGDNGGKGGDGDNGQNGGGRPGAAGASTCNAAGGTGGNGGWNDGSGSPGDLGSTGASGGGAGSYRTCAGLGQSGSAGGTGDSVVTNGSPGSPGGSSDPIGTLGATASYVAPFAPKGHTGGSGGSGGGGGGGGGGSAGIFNVCGAHAGGGGGGGGAGGCGGNGGGGGQGGGASIGIAAVGGHLVVEGNTFTVGKGGNGGDGTSGGPGGGGNQGGSGGTGVSDGRPGGGGGSGSDGGPGGAGSGGVGGPSTCVASTSSVNLTFQVGLGNGKNSCSIGGGGGGGTAGSTNGTNAQPGGTGQAGSQLSLIQ